MLRSLYTGVDGLKTHQLKMDVIGNNIANVNTVAFKSSSVSFKSLLYQTQQSAQTANAAASHTAVNAKQIGLGTAVSSITSNITSAGAAQNTGNPFDLRISGDSFFIVSDGTQNFFTKAGAFYVDEAGNLAMTSNGYNVMGWQSTDGVHANEGAVSPLKITTKANEKSPAEATSKITVGGIIDKNAPGLSSENGETLGISFYDANGNSYVANFKVQKTDTSDSTGTYQLTLAGIVDSESGKALKINGGNPSVNLTFSRSNGEYTGGNVHLNITATAEGENAKTFSLPGGLDIDFSNAKLYGNGGVSTINATKGDKEGMGAGRSKGKMSGVAVQADGKIYASYTNGTNRLLGQIVVANFKNPTGLEKAGENLYLPTENSGYFNGVGEDITKDGGTINAGQLEMSNVDLSEEFTDMITTQRGFQVNSRVITVSDQMLQTLEDLKR